MSDMIKGTMISYRPDIKVLDATIRDGGLVNNFAFTDDFVRKRRNRAEKAENQRAERLPRPRRRHRHEYEHDPRRGGAGP